MLAEAVFKPPTSSLSSTFGGGTEGTSSPRRTEIERRRYPCSLDGAAGFESASHLRKSPCR